VVISGDAAKPEPHEDLAAYGRSLLSVDIQRQNRIRAQVLEQVVDPNLVKKLQPWYPSWCRRPCYQNDYLPAFNLTNVTLVDTDGKDIDQMTADSLVVVIFATGFRPWHADSLAAGRNAAIFGLNGVPMEHGWARSGPATIHRILDHQFPNLFFPGPFQSISSPQHLLPGHPRPARGLHHCRRRA
jgi:cation diffusion facilitator CzcD-associated flavoprotein CzcO